jgi:hypothetical protein
MKCQKCEGYEYGEKHNPISMMLMHVQTSHTHTAPRGFNGRVDIAVYWCSNCGVLCIETQYGATAKDECWYWPGEGAMSHEAYGSTQ